MKKRPIALDGTIRSEEAEEILALLGISPEEILKDDEDAECVMDMFMPCRR